MKHKFWTWFCCEWVYNYQCHLYLLSGPKKNRTFSTRMCFSNTMAREWTNCLTKNQLALIKNRLMVVRYSTSLTPSPIISLSHMKKVLNLKKMEVKDGYTCLTTRCVSCNYAKSSEGHLFINKVTGYFVCSKCKASGSWESLEKMLRKDKPYLLNEETSKTHAKWTSISEKSQTLQSLSQDKIENVMRLFQLKDSCQGTLLELEPLINSSGTQLYIPLKYDGDVVGVKELNPNGEETTVPNVGCKGLVILKSNRNTRSKSEAVIVHSVRDVLALGSCDLQFDVISLPHGTLSLPQEVLPLLENYTKITLWFGNEGNHWESARQFAKKLNEGRCYFVRPTEDHPTPHKAQEKGRDLKEILSSARPVAHKCITHFTLMREDVLTHLQNIEKVTTLWGSFEIRNERLARTMLQQLCQFPLHQHLDKFDYWADKFQLLPIYFMTFYGQQPLKAVMEAVEHAAYVHDISHVIIDNVQFMMGLSESDNSLDRFYRQDAIIGAFRNFSNKANCHVTLVIHPRKERDSEMLNMNSVFGGVKATQEADNVFIIQQKTLQNLKLKKFLQIAKNRYSGDIGVMPLEFDKESLSFAQKSSKKETDFEPKMDENR